MSDRRIYKTAIDEVTTSQTEDAPLGSLRWEGGKLYKYVLVRNTTATVAGAAGDIVCYEAEDGAENGVCVLDKSDADTKPIGAGVLQAAVAGVHSTQVSYYCWIQLTGPATLNTAIGGSAGDGDTLMAGGTDLALTKFTNDDSTETNDGHPCAVANDASAKKVICQFPI